MKHVVLCACKEIVTNPQNIGLDGEELQNQNWLKCFCDGDEARCALLGLKEIEEVWVCSCGPVEPINVAAAIKQDSPDRSVYLLVEESSCSLLSRAKSAQLDGVLVQSQIASRYLLWKHKGSRLQDITSVCYEDAFQVSEGNSLRGGESTTLQPHSVCATMSADHEVIGEHQKAIGEHNSSAIVKRSTFMQEKEEFRGPEVQANAFVFQKEEYRAKQRVDFVNPTNDTSDTEAAGGADGSSVAENADGSSVAEGVSVSKGADGSGDVKYRDKEKTLLLTRKQAVIDEACQGNIMSAQGSGRIDKEPAFVLPILSGSGGSGKSTISALSALITQKSGLKTVLVDLDLQFGDMKELFGVKDALYTDELLRVPMRLKQLTFSNNKPALLCAPRALEKSEEIINKLPQLIDLLRSSFDVIVVNTGSFWSEEHALLLELCSRALFLVDQRPSSLRACQRALDLCSRCGIATSPLVFVVNKCCKGSLYSSIDVSCALRGAVSKELTWGGNAVEELLAAGQISQLIDTRNSLVVSLTTLLKEIVPTMNGQEEIRTNTRKKPLFRMLFNKASIV